MTRSHRISIAPDIPNITDIYMQKEKEIRKEEETKDRPISRKQAIKKAGCIALSAATMMMLLGKPENAQATSPASMPDW